MPNQTSNKKQLLRHIKNDRCPIRGRDWPEPSNWLVQDMGHVGLQQDLPSSDLVPMPLPAPDISGAAPHQPEVEDPSLLVEPHEQVLEEWEEQDVGLVNFDFE